MSAATTPPSSISGAGAGAGQAGRGPASPALKLYFAPQTRAGRPRWLLEELGVPYELVRVDLSKGEQKSPDYLQIHPLGVVPALIDEDTSVIESVAICLYLADRFPEKNLAPPPGSARRGAYYQWILFMTATLEPPLGNVFLHGTRLPPEERNPQILEQARKQLATGLRVLEDHLKDREYLLGAQFTAADVVLGSGLLWGSALGVLAGLPNILSYVERLKLRPALARSRE